MSVLLMGTDHGFVPSEQIQESSESDGSDEPSFTQSFDVVAQNVQLILETPALPDVGSFEIEKPTYRFTETSFKLTSTHFYRILFRLIIATNAP